MKSKKVLITENFAPEPRDCIHEWTDATWTGWAGDGIYSCKKCAKCGVIEFNRVENENRT